MTKKERDKIKKAIDYFLDDDPDKFVDGIDELFLLLYKERWSDWVGLNNRDGINVMDLLKDSIRRGKLG